MEIASHDIVRTNESISAQISGNVKISATEGTGTFWLIPRLVEIQRAYPGLLIDFNCTMNPADVSNLEADVSVQLRRPSSPDLKITRLGRLHTMPFAAQSYIDLFGLPKSVEKWAGIATLSMSRSRPRPRSCSPTCFRAENGPGWWP